MNRVIVLTVILCAFLSPARSQTSLNSKPQSLRRQYWAQNQNRLEARAAHMPSSATNAVIPTACPAGTTGAVCGFVKVPLDRAHPKSASIYVFFELTTHSAPGPAESAILMNFGGPGGSTNGELGFAQFLFASNLDVHDLLLIDDRGTGLSATIDCEPLQHGTEGFDKSIADCAGQLGHGASLYGSSDIAKDADAVRTALGYDQVDYFGASYGGVDVSAYATRFAEHLRTVVLDAPFGTPGLDPLAIERFRTSEEPLMVQVDCSRSPSCSPDHPDPVAEFNELVQSVRERAVRGQAFDAGGNPVQVKIDEDALLNYMVNGIDFDYVNIGELLAAAHSLSKGDKVPLLRLGAENIGTLVGDSGDPTGFSAGAFYAIGCDNAEEAWDWDQSVAARQEQYETAVASLSPNFYAPFSKAVATGLTFSHLGRQCLHWQKPEPSSDPVTPQHPVYPHVPTLVLDGDLDNTVPHAETKIVASLFPRSTSVLVAEAGHETVGFSPCAQGLVAEFIENRQLADTSCAETPFEIFPAVGRFPLYSRDARTAAIDHTGGNQAGPTELKVVTTAVQTMTDALQRVLIGPGNGVGLRGGTFATDFGDTIWTTTLTNCSFAKDVIVSGTVSWAFVTDSSVTADLIVSGTGTSGGTLHVEGVWQGFGPPVNFKISGTLGRDKVAALVPGA